MNVAEDVVDQLRANVLPLRFELRQIARQRIEKLLGLAGELLSRAIVVASHR